MKKFLLLLPFVSIVFRVAAQNDSSVFVNALVTKKLTAGVRWKAVQFSHNELFNSNQSINFVEIPPHSKRLQIRIAHSDSLETTSQLAESRDALVAINGSFFKMRAADPDHTTQTGVLKKPEPSKIDRNRSIVYLKEDGTLISPNDPLLSGQPRKRHLQGSLVVSDTAVYIVKDDSTDISAEDITFLILHHVALFRHMLA